MAKETYRKIQPAHKSSKLTVREAKDAWLKVDGRTAPEKTSASTTAQRRSNPKGRAEK